MINTHMIFSSAHYYIIDDSQYVDANQKDVFLLIYNHSLSQMQSDLRRSFEEGAFYIFLFQKLSEMVMRIFI